MTVTVQRTDVTFFPLPFLPRGYYIPFSRIYYDTSGKYFIIRTILYSVRYYVFLHRDNVASLLCSEYAPIRRQCVATSNIYIFYIKFNTFFKPTIFLCRFNITNKYIVNVNNKMK